jgi:outer membrane biosynthesis protein TonB
VLLVSVCRWRGDDMRSTERASAALLIAVAAVGSALVPRVLSEPAPAFRVAQEPGAGPQPIVVHVGRIVEARHPAAPEKAAPRAARVATPPTPPSARVATPPVAPAAPVAPQPASKPSAAPAPKQPDQPPPLSAQHSPPPTPPAPTATRPGHGYGDKNHTHTGPPGQSSTRPGHGSGDENHTHTGPPGHG